MTGFNDADDTEYRPWEHADNVLDALSTTRAWADVPALTPDQRDRVRDAMMYALRAAYDRGKADHEARALRNIGAFLFKNDPRGSNPFDP